MGETENARQYPPGSWPLDTPGGRYYAEWDGDAPVTREGQLIFFFQFLHAGGRWEEFLRGCPLHYTGNRGSGAPNVMGTVLLSVLSGHWRYAHINGVRGDGVNPGLLGIDGTVSEDAVRAAMKRTRTYTVLASTSLGAGNMGIFARFAPERRQRQPAHRHRHGCHRSQEVLSRANRQTLSENPS
ncbi:MAG: hypothetical protein NTV46_01815 [Verrucomicrobia bacterium]|nr:hypothetical protein [Verrucomicrobiota bacterium]